MVAQDGGDVGGSKVRTTIRLEELGNQNTMSIHTLDTFLTTVHANHVDGVGLGVKTFGVFDLAGVAPVSITPPATDIIQIPVGLVSTVLQVSDGFDQHVVGDGVAHLAISHQAFL